MQESQEQYRQRMFRNTEGKNPIKLQSAAPKRIERLLRGLSPAKARKRLSPGNWSIAEILAHTADTELVTSFRTRFILGSPGAAIQAFDQDVWATTLRYDKRDVRKSFEQYRVLREGNLALYKQLTPEQWKAEGLHSERGPQSIETFVRMTAGHDVNHIAQIERIVKEGRQ